jgi:putative solute:sodium symporter small subunit
VAAVRARARSAGAAGRWGPGVTAAAGLPVDQLEEVSMQLTERHEEYWRRNLRITGILLAVWFVVTFVCSYFARELNEIVIFGFPLGFYMGAQGSLIVYLIIIGYYARYMNRLDEEYGVAEGDDQ